MTKTSKQTLILAILMIFATSLISACSSGTPTLDIDAQKTGFAQTADAQASLTAAAQPTFTSSPTLEATATPTQTETPQDGTGTVVTTGTTTVENGGTDSPRTATATSSTSGGIDDAQWRAQSPEDNTEFLPGETFTVTWKLENTGTSTWTTSYYIQFTSGDQMDAEEKVYLPYPVPPGKNVEVSVDLKAPNDAGEYKSVWSLLNTNDEVFYTNFFIVINVVED
jgi:hypothetical protein